MRKFEHLFFDLDNTILDFSHASHIAFTATMKHFKYADDDSYAVYSKGNAKVWEEFEHGKITAIELRGKRFQIFLDEMGWKEDGFEWNRIYLEHVVLNNKFVQGAKKVIHEMSEDCGIHIVTNGLREVQRPRLRRAGLLSHVDSVTVSDEIGHAKPQAKFFETAMKNAGLSDKSKILMIGDSYNSDIKGASSFGIKTCWYNPTKKEVDSKVHDFEIHHINQLEELL